MYDEDCKDATCGGSADETGSYAVSWCWFDMVISSKKRARRDLRAVRFVEKQRMSAQRECDDNLEDAIVSDVMGE